MCINDALNEQHKKVTKKEKKNSKALNDLEKKIKQKFNKIDSIRRRIK